MSEWCGGCWWSRERYWEQWRFCPALCSASRRAPTRVRRPISRRAPVGLRHSIRGLVQRGLGYSGLATEASAGHDLGHPDLKCAKGLAVKCPEAPVPAVRTQPSAGETEQGLDLDGGRACQPPCLQVAVSASSAFRAFFVLDARVYPRTIDPVSVRSFRAEVAFGAAAATSGSTATL